MILYLSKSDERSLIILLFILPCSEVFLTIFFLEDFGKRNIKRRYKKALVLDPRAFKF